MEIQMKRKIDDFLSKLLSRKLQIVILATVIFLCSSRFSDTSLMYVYLAYIGGNIFQKWIQREN